MPISSGNSDGCFPLVTRQIYAVQLKSDQFGILDARSLLYLALFVNPCEIRCGISASPLRPFSMRRPQAGTTCGRGPHVHAKPDLNVHQRTPKTANPLSSKPPQPSASHNGFCSIPADIRGSRQPTDPSLRITQRSLQRCTACL